MTAPEQAFIVSHTHWDREWYLTFPRFRVNLVRILGEVLDRLETDPDFEHFVLDGQAKILEDHLEIRPEDAARIRKLVEAGALSIGPWYVLPDEFLVSGEATARNLLLGHRVCAALGGAQKAGYMPDSFGHIGQMPQILCEADIDSFLYTRGNGSEIDDLGFEYLWRAPDGSEVLAVNQCGGYCNAGGLGYEELWHAHTSREVDPARAVEQIGALFEKTAELSNGDVFLVSNGCDHFPPQRDFGKILAALREAFPETEFRHTGFGPFLDAVRAGGFAKKTFTGELLGGRHHFILSGVWSARMYLKQENDECQTLLSGVVEPLRAYAHFVMGHEYPHGLLESAWKQLLENHPHDSICGCSIDEVHRDMMSRFRGVRETGEQLAVEALERIVPGFAPTAEADRETALAVANPLPYRRTEVVERLVVLQPFDYDVQSLDLVDDHDETVPWELVEKCYVERFWGVDYRNELSYERQRDAFAVYAGQFGDRILRPESERDERDCYLTVRFLARDLPAVGHTTYRFREGGSGPLSTGAVRVEGDVLTNGLVSVRLHGDGRFDLTDLVNGVEYPGLNAFEDTEDTGDEYDFSPASDSRTVRSEGIAGEVAVAEPAGLRGALEARFTLHLPTALTHDRTGRSGATVGCSARVRVRLTIASPLVEVETEFENRAEDHRLRAEFPTPLATDRLVSDAAFQVISRPLDLPDGRDWVQPPPETRPQQEFSLLEDGTHGLAVLSRGLPEIAARRQGESGGTTLSLTLLRCVGWLSRDDFDTRRRANAGPTLPTPDAQCKGTHLFRYAVLPFAGDWLIAGVKQVSERYRTPPIVKQGVAAGATPGGRSLLEKTNPAVSITAVKRHEERDTLVVRLVNLAAKAVTETLTFGVPVRAAWRTNLLEDRRRELEIVEGSRLDVPLRGHEIATLEIALEA